MGVQIGGALRHSRTDPNRYQAAARIGGARGLANRERQAQVDFPLRKRLGTTTGSEPVLKLAAGGPLHPIRRPIEAGVALAA